METKFQTSFIPKRPSVIPSPSGMPESNLASRVNAAASAGRSILMIIAIVVFGASILSAAGAYLWKEYLISAQNTYKQQLSVREQQFNIDLISQLKEESIKLSTAKQLLANHLALSQIFSIVARLTAENVRFLSMDITAPKSPGGDLSLTLSGYGKDFSAVAFQSDVLGQLDQYGLRKIVKNPIISNPALNQSGTVAFGFTASIDPSSLSYANKLAASAAPSANASSTTP